ncbi:putative DNA metabolism protein [Winogradskyella epiphytica]|uniref:Putative DNA metabolism protein n=1 Tax=Winogradskyella epiphytica TaxID=262005 RepID=A0A2V4XT88_9FLAO|nr:TIGR03915 family putative DNA repair protein [Winogradskyella epiphytica]PYE81581.1 putative DNA metabolism protein [Winogradskyella epiphytica]GGW64098.1 DNA metabolism protein [Winogradskyella epiphytica]
MTSKNLIYDGTFDGFLSTIFYVFEHKLEKVTIQNEFSIQQGLFCENERIHTDEDKANRVWNGVKSKLSSKGSYQLYYAFLSEQNGIENLLLDYITYAFSNVKKVDKDFAHPSVLKIAQIAKSVGREKHRMEAFVRFRLTKDKIFFANIEPDFNVLPLIEKHFKRRYADQLWVIYDIKRGYGLFYDLENVEIITLDFPKNFDFTKTEDAFFAKQEFEFQKLWQDYFKATNIQSRKNMKLHIRHVPKRYWKYLSEKQPD